jgi:tetratricopeptide (TPR) repeat protein
MLGDFDEGERLFDKAIRLASEVKNRFGMAGAHLFRAIVATYRGRPDAVLYHGREAARLSEEIQVPYVLGPSWMIMSWGYYYKGDWPTAREWAEKSISLMTQHQLWPPIAAAHIASGLASRELGDLPAAQRSIETALKVARENRQRGWEAQALTELGRLLAATDSQRTAEAERLILEGISIADSVMIRSVKALGHWCLGETYLIAGAKEAARLNLEKARQMCQEMGMGYYLARTQEALEKLKGSG